MKTKNRVKTSSLLLFVQQLMFIMIPFVIVYSAISCWYIVVCFASLLAVIFVWGIFDIRLALFISVINRLKTKEKKIVLTFDDGPNNCTEEILAVLEEENIQAVFFFIGNNACEYSDIVRKAVQSGHSVGVHTQNHLLKFSFSGLKKVKKEVNDGIVTLEKIAGQKIRLFRPPFGVINPIIAKAIRDLDLQVIGWTIRSLDTKTKNGEYLLKKILNRLSAGAIILLHDIPVTAGILRRLISEIRKKGYEFEKI
jgi:peptidoglycan/xylan/chitin deacetylase (PgdA/CDA1 family)